MGDYTLLVILGVCAVVVVVFGVKLRMAGVKAAAKRTEKGKGKGKKKKKKKGAKETFYRDGKAPVADDEETWQDDNLFAGKDAKAATYYDKDEVEKKDDGKHESWDDY